jgi:hypothetical protein
VAVVLVASRAGVGQVKPVVHVAPEPSDRFLASWYPATNDYTYTGAPVTGAPYTGTMVLTMELPADGGRAAMRSRMMVVKVRDGEGRTRTEELPGEVEGMPGVGGQANQVEVNDVVRHCSFRWMEREGEVLGQATVTCLSREVRWSPEHDLEDSILAQRAVTRQTTPTQVDTIEPLGEKRLDGLRVLGIRRATTESDASGKTTRVHGKEIWWSPELREAVAARALSGEKGPEFGWKDVRLGEPDAGLFYPPRGVAIEATPLTRP